MPLSRVSHDLTGRVRWQSYGLLRLSPHRGFAPFERLRRSLLAFDCYPEGFAVALWTPSQSIYKQLNFLVRLCRGGLNGAKPLAPCTPSAPSFSIPFKLKPACYSAFTKGLLASEETPFILAGFRVGAGGAFDTKAASRKNSRLLRLAIPPEFLFIDKRAKSDIMKTVIQFVRSSRTIHER